MDKTTIKCLVEEYLNGQREELDIDYEEYDTAYDRFLLHTIKRLQVGYDLFVHNQCGLNDFLIPLRDYMLTFQTDISLQDIIIPVDNSYGISKNEENGKYFAGFQFPDYINHSFAEKVFLKEPLITKADKKEYDLHTDPLIKRITGFSNFKSMDQKLAVYGALNTPDGYTTLVSLPTGGGKSLITQTLSYQKDGLTIIIVPTVSLAIDQVRVAKKIIKSPSVEHEVFYYSSGVDAGPILQAIKNKQAKMLFISPEAVINNPGFTAVVKEANTSRYLKNIIIDEAHIVVDWGASFRIDYQCLESWRKKLILSNPSIRTILLSATYEERCISILKSFFSKDGKWIEIRCDSLRHEPRYILVKSRSNAEKQKRMLELVQKLPHPMIIYVARPADADDIKDYLKDNGITNVQTFTGLTTGAKRKELIDQWADDQFEIMIATSAFGVGVDKSDVRTVLHMYIPPNPNAYYQELGRGGRDRLPCLSVMCTHPEDLNIAFQRISKKVMTTEKIAGRWNSMYNSPTSRRIDNMIYIDTSVKPSYHQIDLIDDSPTSDADMNWNIYVLLLLRRFNLIKIVDVISQTDKYIFVIEIVEDGLRLNDELQSQMLDAIRTKEWNYYTDAFQTIQAAIKNSEWDCWSEMFYETYDRVSEYCAGCNAHTEAIESDFVEFPLKMQVKQPTKVLAQDQLSLFGGTNDLILSAHSVDEKDIFVGLLKKRLDVLVSMEEPDNITFFDNKEYARNVLVLNTQALRELVKKKSYYYLSGLVAIKYSGTPREIYELMMYTTKNLSKQPGIKVIHIIPDNTYFDWINKAFADLVDGPVIPIQLLCN